MIRQYLPQTNEKCYSSEIQKLLVFKQGLMPGVRRPLRLIWSSRWWYLYGTAGCLDQTGTCTAQSVAHSLVHRQEPRQVARSSTHETCCKSRVWLDPERAPPDCCGEPITFVHSSKAYYCIVLERLRPVFLFFDDKGRRRKTKKKFILNVHMDIDSGSLDICLLLSVYLCSYLYELL